VPNRKFQHGALPYGEFGLRGMYEWVLCLFRVVALTDPDRCCTRGPWGTDIGRFIY